MKNIVSRQQHLAFRLKKDILIDREKVELFLDYVNNFLTVDGFSEHYGVEKEVALKVILEGNFIHNNECKVA